MKILISSGSRGEWGYYQPIIVELEKRGIDFDVVFFNMAPLDEFGNLKRQVESSLQPDRVYYYFNSHHGDDYYAMAKSYSSLCSSISDHLANHYYDFVLIAGDRIEQLAVASVAHLMYVPVGHIQAGELSGNIDGITRHAIGRLVKVHFAANTDAERRLINSGEELNRIYLTGAPQLDDLFSYEDAHTDLLKPIVNLSHGFILCVFHGVTEELQLAVSGFSNLQKVLGGMKESVIYIFPNNDAGGLVIKNMMIENKRPQDFSFKNLCRDDYLYLLKHARFVIGNSSSGLLEAPVFRQVAINIGGRQSNRVRGHNVIDCGYGLDSIKSAIEQSDSVKVELNSSDNLESPYGDSPAAPRIVDIIEGMCSTQRDVLMSRGLVF